MWLKRIVDKVSIEISGLDTVNWDVIAGGALLGVLVALVILGVIFYCHYRRR